MITLLNDEQGRGEITFELLSHKMSDKITLTVTMKYGTLKDTPVKLSVDREALVKAIGAMK